MFFIDFVLHLDQYLNSIIIKYGILVYLILFLIIFLETGLVVTPFLPGDSLLFSAGAFAAIGSLNLPVLLITLIIAAILGDSINYSVGNYFGRNTFKEDARWLNRKHLASTEEFYRKHGGKTIIIARFIPIIRTFAPFVAGLGSMSYSKFIVYNIIGALSWVLIFVLGGYLFGNIPLIKDNFSIFILIIIIISLIPVIIQVIKTLKNRNNI